MKTFFQTNLKCKLHNFEKYFRVQTSRSQNMRGPRQTAINGDLSSDCDSFCYLNNFYVLFYLTRNYKAKSF